MKSSRSRLAAHEGPTGTISAGDGSSPRRGIVAAGDARTASSGASLLDSGGNAVDAAVASVLASFVAEPILTGPFGGGLALVADPSEEDSVAWSFFAEVPGRGLDNGELSVPPRDFFGAECSFGPTTQVFHIGKGSVAVPLLLPGLMGLHERHGRIPLAEVCAPAIDLARNGVPLSREVGPLLGILEPILRHNREVESQFAPNGPLLKAGERFFAPDLVGLLESVADGDRSIGHEGLLAAFGPPAARITRTDLESARPLAESPISLSVGDLEISMPPPPASGGLLVAFCMALLKELPISVLLDETALHVHLLAAMATANAARREGLDELQDGDSSALIERFLSDEHIGAWLPYYERVVDKGLPREPMEGHVASLGSTTHVSVIDRDGMSCAITHSNGEGCGEMVPATGAMANNFLGEEDLHPRGFHSLSPGSRLTTMMCPTVVTRAGEAELALGSGGSNRIRSAILQVLVRRLWCRMELEAAVGLPRMHLEGRVLYIERRGSVGGFSTSTLEALASRVDEVIVFDSPNVYFGGVHAVARGGKGAGDPRRGGTVTLG